MRMAFLLLGFTCALGAQPTFELQIKDARFGLNAHTFKNFGPASCLEPPERFAKACPVNFDCQRTSTFRIATTGHGLGPQDLRRFYVLPLAQPDAMRCWGADLSAGLSWRFVSQVVGRVGYQAIFLDGVALGDENFQHNARIAPSGPRLLANDDHTIFYGPSAGLTVTW